MIDVNRLILEKEIVRTNYFVLQSVALDDGCRYLLKNFLNPDWNKITVFKTGIELAKELHLKFILEPLNLIETPQEVKIIYNHLEGISLREYIKHSKKLHPDKFIDIALNLLSLVDGFHQNGWLIKNLFPENILIDQENNCRLIDLRRSTKVIKKEISENYSRADLMELRYISPEQTGKLSHMTDNRADLYALGVIYYELITGMLPFQSNDPMELIHAHLALPAPAILKIDSSLPKIINDIILKLLEKSPEDRYQSTEGLKHDLIQARQFFNSNEHIVLAKKDKIKKIAPTTKLIGREDELNILESAYKIALTGKKQCVYINGYSGVGKTRIVQEFYRNKISKNIPITSAKFDVLQKTTPYSALIAAMQSFIKTLLLEDDESLLVWKNKFLENLKANVSIISEVIPELGVLMGPQNAVDALPPEEAQKRFQQTFLSFVSTFTSDDKFLILFLDDLQWADIASIRLIEMILLDDSIRNFLFIGAYRDNEVDTTHPLSISIKKLENWVNLQIVNLSPLTKHDTKEIINQTLHDKILNEDQFSEIIFTKTGGNTFFILQLLTALFEEGILNRNEDGYWEWDEKRLASRNISSNVVDILMTKIESLNPNLQSLLQIGSALGDEFDLKTISMMVNQKMNVVASSLVEAVNIGYLVSMDENLESFFRTISDVDQNDLDKFKNTRFKFSHDRVRQASLSNVDGEKLQTLNLDAARIKIKHLSETELDNEIFFIANHFMKAEKIISEEDELNKLAFFAQRAGEKARNASAFDAAIEYFDVAKHHLNFENNYDQLHKIHLQHAECRYLSGKYDKIENDLDELFKISKTRMDKLNTLFTKVYLHNIQDNKVEAIAAGQEGYKLFNISMPRNKFLILFYVFRDLIHATIKLPEKKISSVLDLPLMKNEEQKRLQEFILALSPTIYQYDQNLFVWNFMRMLFPSLYIGNNGISSFSYIGYGMLVSQAFGKYRMGKKLADVSIALNNKLGYTALKWKVLLSYYNFVHHWTEPIRPELDKILEVENGAYANGDPIFAGYAIFIYNQKLFALGYPLQEVQESFESYLRITKQRHDVETYHFLQGYYYAVRCLRGLESNTILMGASFNAPAELQKSIDLSSFTIAADTAIAYMSTLFMFGHIEEALKAYEQASMYVDFIQQRYEFGEYTFYGTLICCAAIDNKISSKLNYHKKIKQHIKKLKNWKEHCPDNFETQFLIASAEYERVTGKGQEAAVLFEKAIEKADQFRFVNYKGLANELAGKFQYNSGNKIMSKTFLENARSAYQKWGANAKIKQLEELYGHVIGISLSKEKEETQDVSNANVGLELNLILQANKAVESEKDVDNLVTQLMNAIIQYSSADTGYLIVKNNAELIIKANYTANEGTAILNEYADNENLPLNIIKYVIRMKEAFMLNNPAQLPEYGNHRYYQKNKPKSIICFPVLKQGEIFGLLYLENYYHEDVFNASKINILHLISSQVAVSLDNAYLYQNLEKRVLERTEILEVEKGIANNMLENILPKSAIEELKRTGKTTAQKFDNITVLMADIKGFTNISEKLTPEELIGKIDFYFRSFDVIMEKYGLEKIKTIGDAYMAAGGLDGDGNKGAINMVRAALEMQECMIESNIDVTPEEKLEMRIGLNTGSVIAGVVGIKKFQYDMWGDTVNIAARMEQQSEPGRINVSLDTFEKTKDLVKYTYRGKIEAKNKGAMDMYFVDGMG